MKSRMPYIIDVLTGMIISVFVFAYKDIFSAETKADMLLILSDGFFMSGVILCGFGILTAVSNNGALDIFVYGLSLLAAIMNRDAAERKFSKDYADYKLERLKRSRPFWHLVFSGIFYVMLSAAFTGGYYTFDKI